MASSMQPVERRWTSTRKSGMTVLGKVPKPINLPSQKLENHGLDPNVEIVPKGTLTWGTRPLLAASSAWGSSTVSSPRGDGSVGSPVQANGRPSSGGSGTRPSTGSSERSSEPAAFSWGSNSRPSSASGILPSSHMSVAANRPRSAETRPNSSHLSRFAESSGDNIAWGSPGTSEKVVADVSKRSDFILSSGDFPTLGSEKSDEPEAKLQTGPNPKDLAPASCLPSSLKGTSESLLTSGNGNQGLALHGDFNSWNADTHPPAGESPQIMTENWHRDKHNAQPLLDANIPARQYGPWHGPTAHHSNVVWYGGHEAGGLYRPSFGPPGSYHVEPYYPFVPAGALPNPQAFPRAEAIPGGVHLKKGEAYSHIPPESYMAHGQSGIPVRPGLYPVPALYEGCYGPPHTTFDKSSEQDGAVGMPGQHGIHNQHLSENLRLQPWRLHAQHDGSAPRITKQQAISGQANEAQGQYKVLLKQHGGQEDKDASWKDHTVTVWQTAQKGGQLCLAMPEPDLMDHRYKQERTTEQQHGKVSHSQQPNDLVDHDNSSSGNSKSTGHNVTKRLDTAAVHISDQSNAIVKKNASLMEKVEVLNSKTRVADAHFEDEKFPAKEMRSNQNSISTEGKFEEVGPANSCSANNTSISGSSNVGANQLNTPRKVIMHESVLELKPTHQSDEPFIVPGKPNYSEDSGNLQSHNQKRVRNIKGKFEQHGKLKFGSYVVDDTNNNLARESLEKARAITGKSGYLLSMPGSHGSQVVPDDQGSHLIFNSVSDRSSLKSYDHEVQHAKQKELAKQRAIELQKEEEERTAEQKAKALAKLAELDKRASASSKQNLKHAQPLHNGSPNKPDTSGKGEKVTAVGETLHGSLSSDFQVTKHPDDCKIVKLKDTADLSFTQSSGILNSGQSSVSVGDQTWQLGQESNPEVITVSSTLDSQVNNVSRRKQAGFRRRRNIPDESNQFEKLTDSESSGNIKCASMVAEGASDGQGILNSDSPVLVSKNNRGPKYKNKLSDKQLNSPMPYSTHPESDSGKFDLNSNETNPPAKLLELLSVRENNSNENDRGQGTIDLIVESNQAGSDRTKLNTGRASNNWKPQSHRKSVRNIQSDKANSKYQAGDTVIWAPVKVVNKDGSSEVHKSSASEVTNLPDGKNVQDIHNGAKARRAEREIYIPKPVAKELSLQGDFHQSSPPAVPVSSAEKAVKLEFASSSAVTGRDVWSTGAKTALNSTNTEDSKQNRHGKTHPSWRQRNSGESTSHNSSVVESSLSFGPSKPDEKTSELQHSRPNDDLLVEGSNNPKESTTTLGRDHGGVTRQRRQQFKEVRADPNSYAPHSKVLQSEAPNKKEMQPLAPVDSGEKNPSRNENQNTGSGHMKSHWQPKSQILSQHHPHGYKGIGGQRAAEKFLPSQTIEKNPDHSGSVGQRNTDKMKYQDGYKEIKVTKNDPNNQEGSGERKVMKQLSNDQYQPIERDLTAATEPRLGLNRGYISREGDAASGCSKEALSKRNADQHFEHQTGYNKDNDKFQKNFNAGEESSEVHRVSSGSRYGIQGRNHSRRGGHFYGPQRGASVRVNGAYDIGA